MDFSLSRTQANWLKKYARFGYASKGLVYCLTGALALLAATGNGSTSETSRPNVLNTILTQPLGPYLLGLVAIGLLGYVLWRIIEAVKDPHDHGTSLKGVLVRAGYAFSAFVYLAISFYAFRAIVQGPLDDNNGETRRTLVEKVLELPLGQWIIGAIALGILIRGVQQIIKGLSGKYKKNLMDWMIDADYRDKVVKAGAIGCVARGMVWGIVAFLFFRAALNSNPNEAGGTRNALGLISSDFGPWVLALIAIGLICYGIFKIIQAMYLRLNI